MCAESRLNEVLLLFHSCHADVKSYIQNLLDCIHAQHACGISWVQSFKKHAVHDLADDADGTCMKAVLRKVSKVKRNYLQASKCILN